jgi:hypothetical protein
MGRRLGDAPDVSALGLSKIKVRCQRLPVLTDTMEYMCDASERRQDEARIKQSIVCSTLKMEEVGAFETQVTTN